MAAKDVENRPRNIAGEYRGPVAIHAGLADYEQSNMASRAHRAAHGTETDTGIVFGGVVGVVDLVDVHASAACWDRDLNRLASLYRSHPAQVTSLPDNGAGGLLGKVRHCSPWAEGDGWHLELANPRPLRKPIPFKGALGLRNLPDDIAALIGEAL